MSRSADTSWYLTVDVTEGGGSVVLAVGGRLGRAGAIGLTEALDDAVNKGFRRLIVDLGNVDYLSSGGLRALESAAARLHSLNGTLTIRHATGAVKIALDLAGALKEVRREAD